MNIAIFDSFPSFFFNDTATTEIYTLSLHDALPISAARATRGQTGSTPRAQRGSADGSSSSTRMLNWLQSLFKPEPQREDRKSTRLNSSHVEISYAVFCLKKKKKKKKKHTYTQTNTD